eukprot:tig00021489_g21680.t1
MEVDSESSKQARTADAAPESAPADVPTPAADAEAPTASSSEKVEPAPVTPVSEASSSTAPALASTVAPASEAVVAPAAEATPEPPKQTQTNRCWSCNKKIGLTGFKCRCNYVFCGEHRYSDKHSCTFDYKTMAKDLLAKANPVVQAAKVEKI